MFTALISMRNNLSPKHWSWSLLWRWLDLGQFRSWNEEAKKFSKKSFFSVAFEWPYEGVKMLITLAPKRRFFLHFLYESLKLYVEKGMEPQHLSRFIAVARGNGRSFSPRCLNFPEASTILKNFHEYSGISSTFLKKIRFFTFFLQILRFKSIVRI